MQVEATARWGELREQLTYWKILGTGVLSMGKLLITNAGDVKRFRQPRDSEERYVRPPRRYELLPYDKSMRVCRSDERYLRPTRYCNPRAPEVVALVMGALEKNPDNRFQNAEAMLAALDAAFLSIQDVAQP